MVDDAHAAVIAVHVRTIECGCGGMHGEGQSTGEHSHAS